MSLLPDEDIELTLLRISGITLSDMAELIALLIWQYIMNIMESISWESLRKRLKNFLMSWNIVFIILVSEFDPLGKILPRR